MVGIDAEEAGRAQFMEGLVSHGKTGALSQVSGNHLKGLSMRADKTRIVFKRGREWGAWVAQPLKGGEK